MKEKRQTNHHRSKMKWEGAQKENRDSEENTGTQQKCGSKKKNKKKKETKVKIELEMGKEKPRLNYYVRSLIT